MDLYSGKHDTKDGKKKNFQVVSINTFDEES